MPAKLIVLIVSMSLGVIANFLTASYLTAILQVLLVGGLAAGKEGVRRFLIVLSILNLGVGAVFLWMIAMSGSSRITYDDKTLTILLGAFSIGLPLFAIWVLTRRDVQLWMFRRSVGADASPPSEDAP